jgi:hypothetical protein
VIARSSVGSVKRKRRPAKPSTAWFADLSRRDGRLMFDVVTVTFNRLHPILCRHQNL